MIVPFLIQQAIQHLPEIIKGISGSKTKNKGSSLNEVVDAHNELAESVERLAETVEFIAKSDSEQAEQLHELAEKINKSSQVELLNRIGQMETSINEINQHLHEHSAWEQAQERKSQNLAMLIYLALGLGIVAFGLSIYHLIKP
jgi:uncharacterized protein YoxC